MLTLDNVPCVKRMTQPLHSISLPKGQLQHSGDSALTTQHVREAGLPFATSLSCMFLQHVFAAMVSMSQKGYTGSSGGCTISRQQMCLTSKSMCRLASHQIDRGQKSLAWHDRVHSVQAHAALQLPVAQESAVNHCTSRDQVPELQQADCCQHSIACLIRHAQRTHTHTHALVTNSPKFTLCRAMATGPLQQTCVDHFPLHPTIDTPQLPSGPLSLLSPAQPCPYNFVTAT